MDTQQKRYTGRQPGRVLHTRSRAARSGRAFGYALASTVCAVALGHAGLAPAQGAAGLPRALTVGGAPDQVPAEVAAPPLGVVVRVKAPPAGGRDTTTADARTEMGRRMMVQAGAAGHDTPSIVVAYAGGALPPEALDPPPDTLVLLEHAPGLAGEEAREALAQAAAEQAPVADLVLEYRGGALPEEANAPPAGVVVGLLAPSAPAGDDARRSIVEAVPEADAVFAMDIPYTADGLPAEALDPPYDTVIRLEAPPEGATPAAPAALAPPDQALPVSRTVDVPYRAGTLPRVAVKPPPGVLVRLRAP